MAHTYRRFKQLLKESKTRRLRRARKRAATRRRKQKGGFSVPFSGTSTVIARLPRSEDDDLETPLVVRSAQAYVSDLEEE